MSWVSKIISKKVGMAKTLRNAQIFSSYIISQLFFNLQKFSIKYSNAIYRYWDYNMSKDYKTSITRVAHAVFVRVLCPEKNSSRINLLMVQEQYLVGYIFPIHGIFGLRAKNIYQKYKKSCAFYIFFDNLGNFRGGGHS